MRPFIVVGDSTDHGGVVIEGSGFTDTHGKKIARVGDQVTCPKRSHGTTVIVTGDPTMIIDGKPAARHGDKCACGATLISSQFVSTVSDGGSSNPQAASQAQQASAAASGLLSRLIPPDDADVTHDMHFLVKDEETGEPLSNVPYKLTLAGGRSVTGRTDAQGLTEKISSTTSQIAKIEVPYYGDSSSDSHSNFGYDACGC
jgi:uncharacterized Zn-binding protein involved in type VI secretion